MQHLWWIIPTWLGIGYLSFKWTNMDSINEKDPLPLFGWGFFLHLILGPFGFFITGL